MPDLIINFYVIPLPIPEHVFMFDICFVGSSWFPLSVRGFMGECIDEAINKV